MTDKVPDSAQTLADLMAAGQEQMRQFSAMLGGSMMPSDAAGQGYDATALMKQYAEAQQEFMKHATGFWSSMFGGANPFTASGAAATEDKRFSHEAWNDPWADALKRTYLTYAGFLQTAADNAPIEGQQKEQLRFAVRQFVDAMSPSNFLLTNPEALSIARETNGRSLIEGAQLFYQDLAKGNISQTDEKAFEVGRNIATSSGQVIFENDLMQVIQYEPTTDKVAERPLVMVPPCINKFYILDLQPENSLVRYATEQGNTVYMVSWRNAGPAQAHVTWDDYVENGVLEAIDVALDVSGADKVNALGFCVGGTLLACANAVLSAREESKVSSMTLLTTMLDFTDAGEIGTLISEQSVAAKEAQIGNGGILQGKELAFTFSSLRANDLIWQYVSNSYLKGKAPPAFDMLYWNADGTNLPGPMFCWYVRNTYLENNLREPGGTVQCGEEIDLTQVHVPTFLYASREDHIVPWKTAFLSEEILSGDTTFVLGASGHIAGVINHPAKKKRNYWADGARDGDADHWLETAQSTPGSWWPRWANWLRQHAGSDKAAPKKLGNKKYAPIEPAPGRYVKEKAE
jgi:polyhydroxyalkanoate synthase